MVRRSLPVLAAVVMLTAPLPMLAGQDTSAQSLSDPLDQAEIVRDDAGVPHIYADSERALYYANGYVQAKDRLWAMDLFRHISYGEAASVVGPGGGIIEMDLETRRNLYDEDQLREQLEESSPQFKRVAQAFADGVNRAAAEMTASGEMPAEFPLLQHRFEKWRPVDVVATATWQLAFFGNGGGEEVSNAKLFGQLEGQLEAADGASATGGSTLSSFAGTPEAMFVDDDQDGYDVDDQVVLNVDGDDRVEAGDIRWTEDGFGEAVAAADPLFDVPLTSFGPDTEIRYLDQDGDAVLETDEPSYLARGDSAQAGDVRLTNPLEGSPGSKVTATSEVFGHPLTELPDPDRYRFLDQDESDAYESGEPIVLDADTDDATSSGDPILAGPDAGTAVGKEDPSSATVSEAFGDLVWGERDDTYATIQEDDYTENDPHADAKAWSRIPIPQKVATRAAMDAQSFGLDVEESGLLGQGFLADQDLSIEDFGFGSNALVVGPEKSATGEALLGGGPQTGYFNPNLFYELGLHSEELGVDAEGIGALTTPSVIIGRTADMAWTVTSGVSDQTDMVALEATGDRSYEWDEEERRLECREEAHEIFVPPATGGPERRVVTQEVCLADLSITGGEEQEYPITKVVRDGDGDPEWFFARKTSARMDETTSSEKWALLHHQDSVDDFRELFEGFSFTFNFHFAGETVNEDGEREETICYFHVGRQPVRDDRLDPRFPTPSGDEWSWEATITGSELPRHCDPEKGYFANWNNLPQHGWSTGDSRELWGSIHRAERLDTEVHEAFDANPQGLTLDDVKGVLKDAATEDSLAGQIVPALDAYESELPQPAADALDEWATADYPWRSGAPDADPSDGTVSNHTDDDFTEADGLVYTDPGHTVYDLLVPELLDQVFGDELDEMVREVNLDPRDSGDPHAGDHGTANNKFAILVDALEGRTTLDWCDNVTTAVEETCGDQVADAIAATDLDDVTSTDDIDLTDQHQSPIQSLGVGPAFVMPMSNRATYYHFHVGSDDTQHFATLPPGAGGNVNLAEFSILTATGQTPEHMDDQIDDYVDFQPKHVPFDRAAAQEDAESTSPLLVPPALR